MTQPAGASFQADPSMARRILIGLGGVVLLGIGVVVTLGTALIGIAAIVVAWFVIRRRGGQLTRMRAWVVSVVATVVPLIVVFAVSLMTSPSVTPAQRKEMSVRRAQARESLPNWLRSLSPGQQQAAPAADSIAEKLLDNRGFMVWLGAMGALIGSSLIGLFAGSLSWGAAMLLFRAGRGEWLGTSLPPPVSSMEI